MHACWVQQKVLFKMSSGQDSGNDSQRYEGWSDISTIASGYSSGGGTEDDIMAELTCCFCHVGPPTFAVVMRIEMEFLQTGNCFIKPNDNEEGTLYSMKCKR